MPPIVIYTKPTCGYCAAAKRLLNEKNAPFEEIVVNDMDQQRAMAQRAGGRWTVPQIFIGERHVGGCDDLYTLNEEGKLDPLLAG